MLVHAWFMISLEVTTNRAQDEQRFHVFQWDPMWITVFSYLHVVIIVLGSHIIIITVTHIVSIYAALYTYLLYIHIIMPLRS